MHDVGDQVVALVPAVGGKEDVSVVPVDIAAPAEYSVETQDLGKGGARGVPALVRVAVGELRRGQECGEQFLLLDELDESAGHCRRQSSSAGAS
jgi:hypothetical protein